MKNQCYPCNFAKYHEEGCYEFVLLNSCGDGIYDEDDKAGFDLHCNGILEKTERDVTGSGTEEIPFGDCPSFELFFSMLLWYLWYIIFIKSWFA